MQPGGQRKLHIQNGGKSLLHTLSGVLCPVLSFPLQHTERAVIPAVGPQYYLGAGTLKCRKALGEP